MGVIKSRTFRAMLDHSMDKGQELITQIAYHANDIDAIISELGPMAQNGWRKYRQFEKIKTYPGVDQPDAVCYVAHHYEYMPGFETELIQPLTMPNYIGMLGVESRQIAHLGIDTVAAGLAEEIDEYILKRLGYSRGYQLIQKGAVRLGNEWTKDYNIYDIDGFLPVKIIR